MITCTRDFGIDAGHRLLKHEGQCRHVHGHRYLFRVTVTAPQLDDVGRVIDFSVLKSVLGQWLLDRWDHGFLAQQGDPIIPFLQADGSKIYLLEFAPTAENLARYVWAQAAILLPDHIKPVEVVCWETPNCSATYRVG